MSQRQSEFSSAKGGEIAEKFGVSSVPLDSVELKEQTSQHASQPSVNENASGGFASEPRSAGQNVESGEQFLGSERWEDEVVQGAGQESLRDDDLGELGSSDAGYTPDED
jgi:hypothetical protein